MQLKAIKIKLSSKNDDYPFNIPLLKNLHSLEFHSPITILVGENGSGKSTLIEALAVGANLPNIGSHDVERDPTLSYARELSKNITFSWGIRNHRGFFMRAEDFFGFQKKIMEEQSNLQGQEDEFSKRFTGYAKFLTTSSTKAQQRALNQRYGENPDAFSHGESFLNLFMQRLVPEGLYILDEPEVPLSPQRQLALISLIKKNLTLGSQFIIATHSPILMAIPEAEILEIKGGMISKTKYADLDHVNLMKDFLNNPESFLKHL